MAIMTETSAKHKSDLMSHLASLRSLIESASEEGSAVHELEHSLFRGLLQMGRMLLEEFFHRQGGGDVGDEFEVEPGRVLKRSAQKHRRRYVSLFGEFEFQRYVYAPRAGQRIEAVPLDARLKLPAQSVSYLLSDWVQALAVEVAYRPVRDTFSRIFEVNLPVSLLERQNGVLGTSVEPFLEATPAKPSAEGEFVVVSADGKGVPMRRVGRRGAALAPSRRGPKVDKKRMAIVGAVYDAKAYPRNVDSVLKALFSTAPKAANDEGGVSSRDRPIAKLVRAALPPGDEDELTPLARETIFRWLGEQVRARDPQGQKTVVVLIDGQHCLWDDAAGALAGCERVEILDLLHATAKLGEMTHVFYPPGHELERTALRTFTRQLLTGQAGELIQMFRALAAEEKLSDQAQETIRQGCGYFDNHRHRMRYDRYLAAGYPIASGVIEGACRHVVKDRLERSGMRWVIEGAQPMLDLRCVAINGQWDAFIRFRVDQENARLYPYDQRLDKLQWPQGIAA